MLCPKCLSENADTSKFCNNCGLSFAAEERFIHEAQAASALDHPNICTIHEIEETADGRMYIAMAFYEGESLRDRIKREPLKAEEAVDIAIRVGQGMAKVQMKTDELMDNIRSDSRFSALLKKMNLEK